MPFILEGKSAKKQGKDSSSKEEEEETKAAKETESADYSYDYVYGYDYSEGKMDLFWLHLNQNKKAYIICFLRQQPQNSCFFK